MCSTDLLKPGKTNIPKIFGPGEILGPTGQIRFSRKIHSPANLENYFDSKSSLLFEILKLSLFPDFTQFKFYVSTGGFENLLRSFSNFLLFQKRADYCTCNKKWN